MLVALFITYFNYYLLLVKVVVERPSYGCIPDGSSEVQSPVNPTCPLRSPNSTAISKDELDYGSDDFKSLLQNGQNIVDVLSTAMMFQANVLLKVNFCFVIRVLFFFFAL